MQVLDVVLLFFAALVAREPRDLSELYEKPDFIDVLLNFLGSLDKSNDPLWLISCGLGDVELKRAGVTKADKILVSCAALAYVVLLKLLLAVRDTYFDFAEVRVI